MSKTAEEAKLVEDEFRGAMQDAGYVAFAEDHNRVYTFHWGKLAIDFTGSGEWAILNLLTSCCRHAVKPPGGGAHWTCAGCHRVVEEAEVDHRNGYWFEVRDGRLEPWLAATYPRWSPLQLSIAQSYVLDLLSPYVES